MGDMKKALVTGGCGFLGSFIVRELRARGVIVRVLAMPNEVRTNLDGVEGVEVIEGNVIIPADCQRAVAGMDTVFHAAAIYADWAPDPTAMYDVNLRGTFHMFEASRRAGVEKIIYTASIVSVGRPEPGMLGNEETAYEAWNIDFPYSRSKYLSRELAEYFIPWGMDVRVVCPGVVFGPNDIRPTPSGKLILGSIKTPGPAVVMAGGASYVDVRDAAAVHVACAERGKPGERYLATGHNLSNSELIAAIDRVTGRKRRSVRIPVSVARGLVGAMETQAYRTGTPPLLVRTFFEYSLKANYFDNQKSVRELGARYRPIDETIGDAVAYFKACGRLQ